MVGDEGTESAPGGSRLSAIVVGYRQPALTARAVAALGSGSRVPDTHPGPSFETATA